MRSVNAPKRSSNDLLLSLAETPAFLRKSFNGLSPETACRPGPGGTFSPVEHVWHLADLEREAFGVRIQRLQVEDHPYLHDFDGAKAAIDRDYKSKSLPEGLADFAASREANIELFQGLAADALSRPGTQEGVGAVSLGDVPGQMWRHDQEHIAQIREWSKAHSKAMVAGCAATGLVILLHGVLNWALVLLYYVGGSEMLPTSNLDWIIATLLNTAGYVAAIFISVYVFLAPFGRSIRTLARVMISLPWLLALAVLLPQGTDETTFTSMVVIGSLVVMSHAGERVSRWLSRQADREYW